MSTDKQNKDEVITITGSVKFESGKAILFKPNEEFENTYDITYETEKELKQGFWIPFSQVKKIFKSTDENMDHIIVTRWIALKKGIDC